MAVQPVVQPATGNGQGNNQNPYYNASLERSDYQSLFDYYGTLADRNLEQMEDNFNQSQLLETQIARLGKEIKTNLTKILEEQAEAQKLNKQAIDEAYRKTTEALKNGEIKPEGFLEKFSSVLSMLSSGKASDNIYIQILAQNVNITMMTALFKQLSAMYDMQRSLKSTVEMNMSAIDGYSSILGNTQEATNAKKDRQKDLDTYSVKIEYKASSFDIIAPVADSAEATPTAPSNLASDGTLVTERQSNGFLDFFKGMVEAVTLDYFDTRTETAEAAISNSEELQEDETLARQTLELEAEAASKEENAKTAAARAEQEKAEAVKAGEQEESERLAEEQAAILAQEEADRTQEEADKAEEEAEQARLSEEQEQQKLDDKKKEEEKAEASVEEAPVSSSNPFTDTII